ncbi:hypothetical protein BDN71DRAFT_1193103 [Pleurotus eryngii]|uniref:Uncharacterized protein n=1 Tax=Pleurotus eryngii TaxID=5323 RepID=A0A9P6A758_PLEER|nr:hypothetical protein BDN71DRAFT_1193103 [Pleurotus eryngii]
MPLREMELDGVPTYYHNLPHNLSKFYHDDSEADRIPSTWLLRFAIIFSPPFTVSGDLFSMGGDVMVLISSFWFLLPLPILWVRAKSLISVVTDHSREFI